MRRTLLTLGVLLAVTAGPASAHTVGGGGPTNFTTRLGALTPATSGLRLTVIENGSRLQLDNRTGQQVIVLDYDQFPYLRVDAHGGTYTNVLSQATYLNSNRNGTAPVPNLRGMDTGATQWKRTGDGTTLLWHDHRIHYIATVKPPEVRADPGHRHLISTYTIELTVGGAPVHATGDLLWEPGPSGVPWWIVAAAAAIGCALLPRLRRWRVAGAAALAVVVAADVVHTVGIALVKEGTASQRWQAFAVGSWVDVVGWVVGLVAAFLLLRKRIVSGFFLAAGAGALIAVIGGFGDLATLDRSTAPFRWSIGLARAVTALSIGGGLGMVVMTVLGLRRHDRPAPQPSAASAAASQASSIDVRSESS